MYKMNEIINKNLLAEDRFMPEIHLRELRFTYIACGHFTKNKEQIQKFKGTRDSEYINQNQLDKACSQHDMTHGDFENLPRRAIEDKTLHDKAFNIVKCLKYDGYQRELASVVYKFLIKKLRTKLLKLYQTKNHLKYYAKQLSKILSNEQYIQLLQTIFEVLI